jgi:hypothetical protein
MVELTGSWSLATVLFTSDKPFGYPLDAVDRHMIRRFGVVWAAMLLLGGCLRVGFAVSSDDGSTADDGPRADALVDVELADMTPPPPPSCEAPEVVVTLSMSIGAPAISADGLHLTAVQCPLDQPCIAYRGTRAKLSDGFGNFIKISWPAELGDPAYFDHQGSQRLMGAQWTGRGSPSAARALVYCTGADGTGCVEIALRPGSLADVDGPTVIADQGGLLMLFNQNNADTTGEEIYVARASDPGSWEITQLKGLRVGA